MNSTAFANVKVLDGFPSSPAWYHTSAPSLIPGVPDYVLAAVSPLPAYWIMSGIFHFFDVTDILAKYRIHESAEMTSRNRATKIQVLNAVIIQQIVQTALGLWWVEASAHTADPQLEMQKIAAYAHTSPGLTWWLYWWGIPSLQILAAMFILDTWQYFLHRAMHLSPFLYRHLHSVHHRLYVPYAYGALYNHPIEGFLLDSLGAAIAEYCTGLNARQAVLFFVVSTCKTVDDHCGYKLPWDPFQALSANNADYHDIHHQAVGIKSNFSQPFFIHWDAILGTRLTRKDITTRRQNRKKSQ